ncbi:TonB-linked outer membrane protein, SusC/RagA family [bacterium A37T11]|nr:TonB-linked outer membrane protein, SusC/RagA family [bacterium A37T11]
MRVFILLFISTFFWIPSFSQQIISGKVISSRDGSPIVGSSIILKGGTHTTATDAKGTFSISAAVGSTIIIKFIGFQTKEVLIETTDQQVISLEPEVKVLDEVVVTALGIKRSAKSLGYSVGEVKSEDLTKVPQENLINSLNGRVAGIRVINTTSDINSDPIVMIRGFTSLSGGNSPLVVVDGLPTGNDISVLSDISPDNVESVNVLKGPSAAALYGSRAGSGVLLVTTKSGNKSKDLGINFNTSYSADIPYKYVPLQQRFATGVKGNFDESSNLWWGPEMGTSVARFGTDGVATPLKPHPDNVKDFVNVGGSYINNVSFYKANDNFDFNFSISDSRATGIYPDSKVHKDAVSFSASYKILDNLKVSGNFNYLNSGSGNYRGQSYDNYPYEDLYFTPNWLDINDLKDYWSIKDEQQNVWSSDFNNPWFTVNENLNSFRKVRPYGNAKIDWNINKEFSVMVRIGGFNENYTTENRTALSEKSQPNGSYAHLSRDNQEINADVLLNYKENIRQFSFDVSAGGNLLFKNGETTIISGNQLLLPGLYTASNIDNASVIYSTEKANKRINSVYGMASIGFKDAIYVDLSGRKDWSSTLPLNNRSYFYPSVSLSALVSELFMLPESISLLKLRGGWAKVGKDTDPYKLTMSLDQSTWGDHSQYSVPSVTPSNNLLPESIISSEAGFDLSLFQNRLGLNFTYYKIEDKNQITSVSINGFTGYTGANVNAGTVVNKGIEASLHAVPVKSKNINWDVTFNFTKEKSKLTELPNGVSNYQFWERNDVYNQTKLNGTVGDLWGPDVLRVTEGKYAGWPLLDGNGYVQANTEYKKLGNVMPDFTIGFQTNFSYKRLTLSASIDWRHGGDYYSESMKRLVRDGRAEKWYKGAGSSTFTGILSNNSYNGDNSQLAEEIRANPQKYNAMNGLTYIGGRTSEYGGFDYGGNVADGIFFPGVISDGNGGYVENFGNTGTQYFSAELAPDTYWDRGVQTWIYDASFVKLREVAIAYKLPDQIAQKIGSKGLNISYFLKNILIWTKAKNNIDPESTMMNSSDQFTPETNYNLGWDRASFYPWSMTMGIKVNVLF